MKMANRKPKTVLQKLAWGLVIGSFPVWLGLFAVPFLPLPVAHRTLVGASLAILGELMFWGGGAILGTEVLARFRTPKVTTGQSFVGKRVGVVGANGGLGEALVRALQREGAEVVALCLELTDPQSLELAAEQAGELDILVCAAGYDVRKALAAHRVEEVLKEVGINLTGPMLLARAFLPNLREGGALAILGGFADGRLALPYYSVDVASRAGVAAFCEAMNRELSLEGRDVRLCYLGPAPADTEAERPYLDLWRKLGSPLVSPDAVANFILGALLSRRPVSVMGWSNRLIARLNILWPELADGVVLGRVGKHLQSAFGLSKQEL